mgnify:CR=1 FL=1
MTPRQRPMDESMTDREKIQTLELLEHSKYEKVDLDHLMMYAVARLEELRADLSFENIVAASYRLFPEKFSLLGFPEYPDSNRVNKALWRLSRDKKKLWLGGRVRRGFVVTDRSRRFIKEAEMLLQGKLPTKAKASSQTRRKEALLADVLSSPAYHKYAAGDRDSITEGDFCFLLQGTLDSFRETLRENLAVLQKFTRELQRDDLVQFLAWLEEKFHSFLYGEGK